MTPELRKELANAIRCISGSMGVSPELESALGEAANLFEHAEDVTTASADTKPIPGVKYFVRGYGDLTVTGHDVVKDSVWFQERELPLSLKFFMVSAKELPAIKAGHYIDNMFTYHAPKEGQTSKYTTLREEARALAHKIDALCPIGGPERTEAINHLREAVMWANASIACNE